MRAAALARRRIYVPPVGASLAQHGSTPALAFGAVSGGVNYSTATTASFTPPAGALLVCCMGSDAGTTGTVTLSITDNLGSHLTYTQRAREEGSASGYTGAAAIYTAPVITSAAMTVSVTTDGASFPGCGITLQVFVFTGANTSSPVGSSGVYVTNSSTFTTGYTSTQTGSVGILAYQDGFGSNAAPTAAASGCTIKSARLHTNDTGSASTYAYVYETAASTSVGQTVSLGLADSQVCAANVAFIELLHA